MLLTSLKKSLKGNYSICQSSGHCHVATKSMKARRGNPFGFRQCFLNGRRTVEN